MMPPGAGGAGCGPATPRTTGPRYGIAYECEILIGKVLNALLLDRVEQDVDRLQRINVILDAGRRAFGPGFLDAINAQMGDKPMRSQA